MQIIAAKITEIQLINKRHLQPSRISPLNTQNSGDNRKDAEDASNRLYQN